jgi:hypothetical protein
VDISFRQTSVATDILILLFKKYWFIEVSMEVFICLVSLMVNNATFNNISVISWRSVLLVEETKVPGENH